jgi:CubicO group peptidase (beta-lactamase class C family)
MNNLPAALDRSKPISRRALVAAGAAAAGGAVLPALKRGGSAQEASPVAGSSPDEIVAIAEQAMTDYDLKAVILSVLVDGEELVTQALGESITGVPATTDMHFRNGAVAISYVSTLMLILVDEGLIGLDDPIAPWLPDLPDADTVTFRMLANMTAGYRDYVQSPALLNALNEDPFRQYEPEELIAFGFEQPRIFDPGTNWEYAHTAYVILGLAMEAVTGQPVEAMMQERVLNPLGLDNTANSFTAEIPEPVLHAFSSERREWFGIKPGQRFYEETTYWNPSWTITHGAIQTTNIHDMVATAVAIGEGTLLSPESHAAQIAPGLLGFGAPLDGCNSCRTLNDTFNYGLGVVLNGQWIVQNPLFWGYSGTEGYLPSHRIAIAVAVTYGEGSFGEDGDYLHGNVSTILFTQIRDYLVPEQATPVAG